jgi:hypothetical protein
MRIFIFKSEADVRLRAFADDHGSKLPAQFRPWSAIGSIAADGTLPTNSLAQKSRRPSMIKDFNSGA